MPAKKGDIKAAVFVIHGSKDPVAPKADRDALEAEMDGAGANWQMLDFGGRLHSFAEEETDDEGRRRISCRRRAPDLPDARRLHPGRVQQEALTVHRCTLACPALLSSIAGPRYIQAAFGG